MSTMLRMGWRQTIEGRRNGLRYSIILGAVFFKKYALLHLDLIIFVGPCFSAVELLAGSYQTYHTFHTTAMYFK
jgi:hypothetical protein